MPFLSKAKSERYIIKLHRNGMWRCWSTDASNGMLEMAERSTPEEALENCLIKESQTLIERES